MAKSSIRTSARLGVLAGFAVLVLSGCVRLTSDTTVSDADTFSQVTVIAATPAASQQLGGAAGVELSDLKGLITSSAAYKELTETYPGQVVVEDFEDGDLTGVQITTRDLPLEAFEDSYSQVSSSLPLTGNATLVHTGDTYVVTIPSGGAADALEQAGISPGQLGLLSGQVEIGFSFAFPGLVTSATAGDIDGKTVTLGIADLASGEDITIIAGAGNEMNWKPWLMWGGIGIAALVIVGGATALIIQDVRRHRSNKLPPPEAAAGLDAEGPGVLGSDPEAVDPTGDEPGVTDGDDDR